MGIHIALYRAKVNGRSNFRFFESEMDAQVQKRAKIERDLRQAINEGTVRPYYQPIVDLKTGRITGFEALARWYHPEFGELEPEQFIGIAEDGGLIIPLSSHLLRIAARDATQWPSDVKLCFNISRVQLSDPMMVLRILQILGETGLSPTRRRRADTGFRLSLRQNRHRRVVAVHAAAGKTSAAADRSPPPAAAPAHSAYDYPYA